MERILSPGLQATYCRGYNARPLLRWGRSVRSPWAIQLPHAISHLCKLSRSQTAPEDDQTYVTLAAGKSRQELLARSTETPPSGSGTPAKNSRVPCRRRGVIRTVYTGANERFRSAKQPFFLEGSWDHVTKWVDVTFLSRGLGDY